MTQFDFYKLEATSRYSRLEFACRLAETIYQKGHRVFINCSSASQAEELSQQLWASKPSSFLPHKLLTQTSLEAPITLGWKEAKLAKQPEENEVLLNLSLEVPEFFSAYARVTEIMDSTEEVLEPKRKAWAMYKDRGYQLKLHTIN